ncbi:MAG: S8 family serine peptidase [Pseudomonadota bacterium]
MKRSTLTLAILLSLGLTACGGGGGGSGTANPIDPGAGTGGTNPPVTTADACTNIDGDQASVPPGHTASGTTCTLVDACLNYDGNQTLVEIADKGFVCDDASGNCQLERNHAALSTTGIDVVRMAGYTGNGIGVAIVDTGYLPDHSEYMNSLVVAASYHDANANYILDAGEKVDGDYSTDVPEHGTAVTSQAGGMKSGTATACSLYLKGVHGDMSSQHLLIATKDAIQSEGLPVINHSNAIASDAMIYWSASAGYDPTGLMFVLSNSGSVLVSAAGNSATSLSESFDSVKAVAPEFESFLDYPQEAENFLAVGSYDRENNDLALYSNYPGHRESFQSRFIVAGDYAYEAASSTGSNAFEWVLGTSAAAPQVSGAIAVLMEVKPGLTAIEAAQILLDTAKQLPEWGYGQTCTEKTDLGTFTTDCGAMKFGRGLMDLPKAVEMVRGM